MAPRFVPTPVGHGARAAHAYVTTAQHVERDEIVTIFSIIDAPTTAAVASAPGKKLDVGPIVGGLVGGICGGLLLMGIVWCLFRYRKHRRKKEAAILERRQRRLTLKRQTLTKSRQSIASSSASSGRRLHAPSEKSFDPSIPVAAPARPTKTFASPKKSDQFVNEKGYGYEPEPMAYVHAGGNYYIQQPYEQLSIQEQQKQQKQQKQHKSRPPSTTRPVSSSSAGSRGSSRAAAADQAALAAARPVSLRHRPSRPSPLSYSTDKLPNSILGPGPQPGHSPGSSITWSLCASSTKSTPSMSGSSGSGSPSPTSSPGAFSPPPSYPSSAEGASWGIALGDPESDKGFAALQQTVLDRSEKSRQKTVSAQYRSDPFVEYHIYDRELLGGLEEEIAIEEEDANVIDLSDE